MSDPGIPNVARLRYEVQVASGPREFNLNGVIFKILVGGDIVVLVRVTEQRANERWQLTDETIVGVIGDPWENGAREFQSLRAFMTAGGVIGLHGELL
jgi:hypothetical protein